MSGPKGPSPLPGIGRQGKDLGQHFRTELRLNLPFRTIDVVGVVLEPISIGRPLMERDPALIELDAQTFGAIACSGFVDTAADTDENVAEGCARRLAIPIDMPLQIR